MFVLLPREFYVELYRGKGSAISLALEGLSVACSCIRPRGPRLFLNDDLKFTVLHIFSSFQRLVLFTNRANVYDRPTGGPHPMFRICAAKDGLGEDAGSWHGQGLVGGLSQGPQGELFFCILYYIILY